MKSLRPFISKYIAAPFHKAKTKFFNKPRIEENCKTFSNTVFKYSKETALIMLFGNALAIFSSHNEQIKGLKKSDRENKDYLIKQERIEKWLDLGLSIIPPFIINRVLRKNLEGGKIITKDIDKKMKLIIGPETGCHFVDYYSTKHIRPVKETILNASSKFIDFVLKKSKRMTQERKDSLRAFNGKIKSKLPDYSLMYIPASTLDIVTKFDDLNACKSIRKALRNGKATDEIYGFIEGLSIAAVIAYSVISSNVLMPIIKHKISKYSSEREMKRKGITPATIARQKRYAYNTVPAEYYTNKIFTDNNFSTMYNKTVAPKIAEKEKQKTNEKDMIFQSFNDYNKIASKSVGFRI